MVTSRSRARNLILMSVLGSLACSLLACGKNPAAPPTMVTLGAEPNWDGYVQSNGLANPGGSGPGLGDNEVIFPGIAYREFFGFDLEFLPGGAHIVSATLQLYQAKVTGSPYTDLGNVIVERIDLGGTLDGSDYNSASLGSLGTLSTNGTLEYKTLDVTNAVQAEMSANHLGVAFRLRFSVRDIDNDGNVDAVFFTDIEDSCCGVNKPPQLVISYTK